VKGVGEKTLAIMGRALLAFHAQTRERIREPVKQEGIVAGNIFEKSELLSKGPLGKAGRLLTYE
jgi:hypothetical protein